MAIGAVPLIIMGNGLGVVVVRELTIRNVSGIKKYVYLKNGAMYSILFLGMIMVMEAFGVDIPSRVSPTVTFLVIVYFFIKSRKLIKKSQVKN